MGGVDAPAAVAVEACVEQGRVGLVHQVYSGHEIGHVLGGQGGEAEDLGRDGGGWPGFDRDAGDDPIGAGPTAAESEEEVCVLTGVCCHHFA